MWPNSGPVTVAVSTTGLARNQKIDRLLQYINIYFLSTHGIILNHSHYSCHLSQVAYNFDFILRPLHYSTPSIFTVISYQGLCFTLHTDPDSIHYPIRNNLINYRFNLESFIFLTITFSILLVIILRFTCILTLEFKYNFTRLTYDINTNPRCNSCCLTAGHAASGADILQP